MLISHCVKWASLHPKSHATGLLVQQFIQVSSKDCNSPLLHYCHFAKGSNGKFPITQEGRKRISLQEFPSGLSVVVKYSQQQNHFTMPHYCSSYSGYWLYLWWWNRMGTQHFFTEDNACLFYQWWTNYVTCSLFGMHHTFGSASVSLHTSTQVQIWLDEFRVHGNSVVPFTKERY